MFIPFVIVVPHPITVDQTEYWVRLIALAHYGGSKALEGIWKDSNLTGLPTDPAALYQYLDGMRTVQNTRRLAKNLDRQQMKIVFPATQQTNIANFDITLTCKLILDTKLTPIKKSGNLTRFDLNNPVQLTLPNLQLGDYISFLRDIRNKINGHF